MKKKRIWTSGIGIVLVASLVLVVFSNQGAEVAVTGVKKGDIKKYVEDIGTVKCKELKTVSIEGSGLIQNVPVEVGQQVRQGDLLLSMEKTELEIQLRNMDEKIKEIEASLEGSEIKNYATTVEKARIAVQQAEDAYELALDDYDDAKVLAEAGAVSSEELKQKEAVLKNAQALMDTAKIDLQQIEANTPDSVKAVYKAQLEQVVLSRESILHSLEKQEVKAPIDGVVLERNVEANTVGIPGTVAFTIGNVDSMEIEAYILADDAADIRLGNEVEIIERSEKKQVFEGKAVKIAPSAVEVTSSLGVNQKKVKVTIEPLKLLDQLKHGYETDVRIITERKNGVAVVPLSSVFDYKDNNCVFVVVDGKAVLRAVEKGIEDEESVEIIDGLKEGELVLSEPDISIKEGMKIKLITE
ncbi:MAG TPA: HlyD family efflux transporter periplasmic adaptor subunit [Clostridia bacterium]|nr:HlyD family efflux transporter periplasmic adaptor subunit [Clostridia bacterium]